MENDVKGPQKKKNRTSHRIEWSYDLVIPLLGIHPKETK